MSTAGSCADAPARAAGRVTDAEVLAGLGVVGLGVACLLSPTGIEDGPVVCPFRLATGLPCPGCGLTRSWVYLVHGRLGDALLANPFGLVTVALVIGLVVAVVRAHATGRAGPRLDRLVRHPVARVVLTAWAVFAAVRLVLAVQGAPL